MCQLAQELTMKNVASFILMLTMGAVAAGCSSMGEERGDVERAGANAGRVVDDSVITGKVKSALVADPTTKAHQINVETFKGTVQLSGFVDSSEARSRASQVASNVDGVKDVKNDLEVRSRN
jgi:osmotically-inducible protein OsmY